MLQPTQQIRFCSSRDGTRIAYAACGAGPTLVWVRHWIGHLKFDWDTPVWRSWLALLSRRHRVLRYDWRGCGLSDREGVEFSQERYLEDLEAVIDAAAPERFALLGMSTEGTAAIAYAARRPERVTSLLLYGSHVLGRLARCTTLKQREEVQTRLKMVELGWPNDTPAYGQFFTSLHIPDATAEQMRSFNDLVRLTTSPASAVALLETFFQSDLRKIAPLVRCPTLVLHARQSTLIPFEEGRSLAALIPDARLVPLESRNHIVLEGEPAWRQLADAVEAFLPAALSFEELTSREREVLELVAQGMDNRRISGRLKISEKTIRNHVSNIFSKLGARNRAHAVALARDAGMGRPPP
jgi:pimeloyl-ACP methyl ester carboxylesterase/DNA-binding CsgD family transcriptional regulator